MRSRCLQRKMTEAVKQPLISACCAQNKKEQAMKKRIGIILSIIMTLSAIPLSAAQVNAQTLPPEIPKEETETPAPQLPVPVLTLKAGEGKITVTWNKCKNVTGYRLFRATAAKGPYKAIANLSAKKSRKHVSKNLKGGKSYYYKMKTYRTEKGKTVYSQFSPVKRGRPLTRLQAQTDRFIRKATEPSMTKQQKLRAAYVYMRDHYKYIKRNVVKTGASGWVNRYASGFFSDGGGNCCSWAAAYTTVAKRLGFKAKAISGMIYYANGRLWGRHGWTEIPMKGKIRVFDPEIEYSYRARGKKISLYQITRLKNGYFLYKRK